MSELFWVIVFHAGKLLSLLDVSCVYWVFGAEFVFLFLFVCGIKGKEKVNYFSFLFLSGVRLESKDDSGVFLGLDRSVLSLLALKYARSFPGLSVTVDFIASYKSRLSVTIGWVLRAENGFLIDSFIKPSGGCFLTGDVSFDSFFRLYSDVDEAQMLLLSPEVRSLMVCLLRKGDETRVSVSEIGVVLSWSSQYVDTQEISALLESVLQLAVQLYAELASQASAEAPLRVHPELKPRREMLTALFNRADAPAWYPLVAPQPIERGQTGQVFAELGRRDERLRSRPLEPRGGLGEGSPWEARYDSASWGRLEPGVQVAMQELYDDGWRFSVQDGRTFLGIEDHWVWSEGFAPRLERACWIAWKLREHAA